MKPPPPSLPGIGRTAAYWKSAPFTSLVVDVATALVRGATLHASGYSVGPYHEATQLGLRFACLDRAGAVVPELEVEEHAVNLYMKERVERQDWTAYGAAVAFVRSASSAAVGRALRDLARGERLGSTRGIDRGPSWRPADRSAGSVQ